MNIKLIAILLSLPLFLFAQENDSEEEVPIPIEEQRNNKIKALLDVVKENKSIYVQKDQVRVKNFIDLVDERESMLAKAKQDLANEKLRNERLEARFEANEKQLAELEESLQIKIGVLGELFGVTNLFSYVVVKCPYLTISPVIDSPFLSMIFASIVFTSPDETISSK